MKKTSVLDYIGNTPLVELRRITAHSRVRIYAKLEKNNPGGSIKDRTALYMIEQAEKRRDLTPDKTILEATSGNTGIGIAMVAAAKGYRVVLVMSEAASEERKKILRALGAELLFTPASLGTDGAIELVYEMLREHPDLYFVADQYTNEDNVGAHYHGTGEEIWHQTEGRVTMAVIALGTSGTAMGVSKRLKEYNGDIRIVGVEPYLHHKIQGLKNMKESYIPGIFDRSRLDEMVTIHDADAFEMTRRLAREEGLFVGMSSGAAMHVALEKAKSMESGVIVIVFPDGGDRYLSTDLFTAKKKTNLALYNTASKTKGFVQPVNPEEIRIHTCGPTVHDVPHMGTYRRLVVAVVVSRFLAYTGYAVKHTVPVIDLSDKTVSGAVATGAAMGEFARGHVNHFLDDVQKLALMPGTRYVKATENIDAMISAVTTMIQRGYAYQKLRSVYFDISKLDGYGTLSNLPADTMGKTHIVERDDYEKDSPADFTLLKRSSLEELKNGLYFKTPWGNVRPSWHLECASIAMTHCADHYDISVSGTDLLFPHCENVRAIGKALTGSEPARHWLNVELIMREGKKMSRSLDNIVTIDDLEKHGYTGREIRYFLLSAHYRKPLTFSFEALDTARNAVRRLDRFILNCLRHAPAGDTDAIDQALYDMTQGFTSAIADDLNISNALATVFTFMRTINTILTERRLSRKERTAVLDTMTSLDSVLSIMSFNDEEPDREIEELIEKRETARREGDWATADAIRDRLTAMSIAIEDTKDGPLWRTVE